VIGEQSDRKPKPPARIHPDERDRIEGLKAIGAFLQGAPQPKTPISYYTPILIQCTLPHSDPKVNPWIRKNGDFSLIVSSGFDSDGNAYGIPYGSFPRLVLAYIITRVIQTGERRIDLSSHFGGFLGEIGYTSNHRGTGVKGKRIRDYLLRLLRASIAFEGRAGTDEKGRLAGVNINVATKYDLWWDFKPTVSLGVTSALVCIYGRGDGRIAPTRCAVIDAGLDGR
jgi:Plasmid encoded RepA protein